jgi:glycosyltransferase involved in cell wall biosynthesis
MGLVIEYSETSLSEAIRFIIDNPNELDRMKVNAKNAYKNYTWERMKKRIQLIFRVIGGILKT